MFASKLQAPEQVAALADLLVGAAHSDHFYAASELVAIITILCEMLGVEELPPELSARLRVFDPETFDIEATCAKLPIDGPEDRHTLLEVIARVINADAVIHDIEDDYLDQVAEAIGVQAFVSAQDFADERADDSANGGS